MPPLPAVNDEEMKKIVAHVKVSVTALAGAGIVAKGRNSSTASTTVLE